VCARSPDIVWVGHWGMSERPIPIPWGGCYWSGPLCRIVDMNYPEDLVYRGCSLVLSLGTSCGLQTLRWVLDASREPPKQRLPRTGSTFMNSAISNSSNNSSHRRCSAKKKSRGPIGHRARRGFSQTSSRFRSETWTLSNWCIPALLPVRSALGRTPSARSSG
jgi:hypothetical protein